MITEYVCCQGGMCPQHEQQWQEDRSSAEFAMFERRNIGNTRLPNRVYGTLA